MSRKRRGHEEVHFGSDSFLDVVANMVGILMILIVIVGMRPEAPPPELRIQPLQVAAPAVVEPAPLLAPLPEPSPEPEIVLEPLPELVLAPLPPLEASAMLHEESARLQAENDSLERKLAVLSERAQSLQAEQAKSGLLRQQVKQDVSSQAQVLRAFRQRAAEAAAEAKAIEADVAKLRQDLAEAGEGPPVTEQLTHRLPPIGRVVAGNEVHFCLKGNRVSHVPVNALAKDVQSDIERRKEILLTRPFYQGTAGPIGGYRMEYVLQRQSNTLNDDLNRGLGVIRIGVTGWLIQPTPAVIFEDADQALAPGSNFRTHFEREGPTATITFWVYPDSYEIHRKLKAIIHESGYWVASRPLPEGLPIAGSPQGSKSVAQ